MSIPPPPYSVLHFDKKSSDMPYQKIFAYFAYLLIVEALVRKKIRKISNILLSRVFF